MIMLQAKSTGDREQMIMLQAKSTGDREMLALNPCEQQCNQNLFRETPCAHASAANSKPVSFYLALLYQIIKFAYALIPTCLLSDWKTECWLCCDTSTLTHAKKVKTTGFFFTMCQIKNVHVISHTHTHTHTHARTYTHIRAHTHTHVYLLSRSERANCRQVSNHQHMLTRQHVMNVALLVQPLSLLSVKDTMCS